MSTELVAFLRARFRKAALPSAVETWHERWCLDRSVRNEDGTCFYCGATYDFTKVEMVPRPDSVLRDLDAKQRIVDAYLPPGQDPQPGLPCTSDTEDDPDGELYAEMLFPDACVRHLKASERLLHWDYVLRLLALPYADHSDYRKEWTP